MWVRVLPLPPFKNWSIPTSSSQVGLVANESAKTEIMLAPIERETMEKDPFYDMMIDTLRKHHPDISEEELDKVTCDLLELARREGERLKMLTSYPAINIHDNSYLAYDYAAELEKRFPGQDAFSFCEAIAHNGSEAGVLQDRHIISLELVQMGSNDEFNWIWHIKLDDNTFYVVEGSCDFTGWDCQSWLDIRPL